MRSGRSPCEGELVLHTEYIGTSEGKATLCCMLRWWTQPRTPTLHYAMTYGRVPLDGYCTQYALIMQQRQMTLSESIKYSQSL